MKLRTKVKRLKEENERLKNADITVKDLVVDRRRIQKFVVDTLVHNANLDYDFHYVDSTTRKHLKYEIADSILDYVEVTTHPDKLNPEHTRYRAELYLYIPEDRV